MTDSPSLSGLFFATLATLCWALNFIAPHVIGPYTAFDFIALKFAFSGLLGLLMLAFYGRGSRRPGLYDLGWPALLGAIGYLGYSSCIMGAVLYGGPFIAPALVGTVPVLLALIGNAGRQALAWSRLMPSLLLLSVGLGLINANALSGDETHSASPLLGLLFSCGAIALWLAFSLGNQRALSRTTRPHPGVWTGAMLLGAGLPLIPLLPFAIEHGLLRLADAEAWSAALQALLAWALGIAVFSSVVGAWAWNMASSRVPMRLLGQLIALETLFATALGAFYTGRVPDLQESAGIGLLLAGVILAVRAAYTPAIPGQARA